MEEKERDRQREWLLTTFVQVQSTVHSMTQDKPIPPTSKSEAEAKPKYDQNRRYKRFREKHDEQFHEALASPAHWGKYLNMEHIFGAPEDIGILPASEVDEAQKKSLFDDFDARLRSAASKQGGS